MPFLLVSLESRKSFTSTSIQPINASLKFPCCLDTNDEFVVHVTENFIPALEVLAKRVVYCF